jgi:hypothetical protein
VREASHLSTEKQFLLKTLNKGMPDRYLYDDDQGTLELEKECTEQRLVEGNCWADQNSQRVVVSIKNKKFCRRSGLIISYFVQEFFV